MIVLGLGSSLGDREAHLHAAVERLRSANFFQPGATSPVYESDAMLPPNAPSDWNIPYLNMCLAGETPLEPSALLAELKRLEHELGRQPAERWAPRTIDIDLVAYDEQVVRVGGLIVPHPGMLERPFVLLPLADVAPHWTHPLVGRTAAELAAPWRQGEVPYHTRRIA